MQMTATEYLAAIATITVAFAGALLLRDAVWQVVVARRSRKLTERFRRAAGQNGAPVILDSRPDRPKRPDDRATEDEVEQSVAEWAGDADESPRWSFTVGEVHKVGCILAREDAEPLEFARTVDDVHAMADGRQPCMLCNPYEKPTLATRSVGGRHARPAGP